MANISCNCILASQPLSANAHLVHVCDTIISHMYSIWQQKGSSSDFSLNKIRQILSIGPHHGLGSYLLDSHQVKKKWHQKSVCPWYVTCFMSLFRCHLDFEKICGPMVPTRHKFYFQKCSKLTKGGGGGSTWLPSWTMIIFFLEEEEEWASILPQLCQCHLKTTIIFPAYILAE